MKPLRLVLLFCLLLSPLRANELVAFDFNHLPPSLTRGQLIEPSRSASGVAAQPIARPSTVYMYRHGYSPDFLVQIALPPEKYTPDHALQRALNGGTFFEVSLAPESGRTLSLSALEMDLATNDVGTGRRTVWIVQRFAGNQSRTLGVASTDASLGGQRIGPSRSRTSFDLSGVPAFQRTETAVTLRVYVMLEDETSRLVIDNLRVIGEVAGPAARSEVVPLATYRFDDLPDPIPVGSSTAPIFADRLSAAPITRSGTLVWLREATVGGHAVRIRPVDTKMLAPQEQYFQRAVREGTFFSVVLDPAEGVALSLESVEIDLAAHPDEGLRSIWLVERTADGNRPIAGPFTYQPGGAANSFSTDYSRLAIALAGEPSLQNRSRPVELRIYLAGESSGSQVRFDMVRVNGSTAGAVRAPASH